MRQEQADAEQAACLFAADVGQVAGRIAFHLDDHELPVGIAHDQIDLHTENFNIMKERLPALRGQLMLD